MTQNPKCTAIVNCKRIKRTWASRPRPPSEMSNPASNEVMDFEEPDEALLDDTDPGKAEIDETTKGETPMEVAAASAVEEDFYDADDGGKDNGGETAGATDADNGGDGEEHGPWPKKEKEGRHDRGREDARQRAEKGILSEILKNHKRMSISFGNSEKPHT